MITYHHKSKTNKLIIYKCPLVTNLALGLWPKLRHEKGNGLEKCFGIQACSKCKEVMPWHFQTNVHF